MQLIKYATLPKLDAQYAKEEYFITIWSHKEIILKINGIFIIWHIVPNRYFLNKELMNSYWTFRAVVNDQIEILQDFLSLDEASSTLHS